jgi:hypothetical protein
MKLSLREPVKGGGRDAVRRSDPTESSVSLAGSETFFTLQQIEEATKWGRDLVRSIHSWRQVAKYRSLGPGGKFHD